MMRPIKVLSVGTPILGNAIYHANLFASLEGSSKVQIIPRSVADYWNWWAKLLFATVGSARLRDKSYRYRAEWVMAEVARIGIKKEMRRLRPDVIHCHTHAHSLRCVEIAKQVPFVVTMDATSKLLRRLPAYAPQRDALNKLAKMEQHMFNSCAVVGGVSRWVVDSIQGDYTIARERTYLCSPCVETNFFSPAPSKRRAVAGRKIRLVFVGNDLERKGGRLLLELMGEGLSNIAELHVVSGASVPASLPRGVAWHGGVKSRSPELLEQLQLADVFVLPTYEDCFPQALIEAMACGLPLVSCNVMGIPELVQNNVNGFCIEPGNKAELAEIIRVMHKSPQLVGRLAISSRLIAEERFSLEISRKTWENIFSGAAHAEKNF